MTSPDGRGKGLAETLGRLRERFLATSGETVAIFTELAERLGADASDAAALETLHRELHRTHGTAGSYGFHAASRTAAALEAVAARWAAEPALDTSRRAAIVRQFAEALQRAFTGEVGGRRVLVTGVADEQVVSLVSELLHRGFGAERVAATALEGVVRDESRGFVGVIAGEGVTLPPIDGLAVTRLSASGDAAAVVVSVSACCGPPP